MADHNENEDLISLFNQEINQIDNQVLTQMNFLGIDSEGIENDLLMNKMNDKTVSYRLLQRAKIGRLFASLHSGKVRSSPSCTPSSPILANRIRIAKRSPVKTLSRNANKRNENDPISSNHTPDAYSTEKQHVCWQRNTFLASPVKTIRPCVKSHDPFHQNNDSPKPKISYH